MSNEASDLKLPFKRGSKLHGKIVREIGKALVDNDSGQIIMVPVCFEDNTFEIAILTEEGYPFYDFNPEKKVNDDLGKADCMPRFDGKNGSCYVLKMKCEGHPYKVDVSLEEDIIDPIHRA